MAQTMNELAHNSPLILAQLWCDGECSWLTWGRKVNLIGLTNFISTVIGPNLTSCQDKLILVTPLGSKTRKLGAFGSLFRCTVRHFDKKEMCLSLGIRLWNSEYCVKSGALEGGLIFHRSLAWDEVLQPVCCCFALKVTGFHLVLVFTASLSEVENSVKPCRICITFWSIQTKLICCIEDFKVFAGNLTLVLCGRNQTLLR